MNDSQIFHPLNRIAKTDCVASLSNGNGARHFPITIRLAIDDERLEIKVLLVGCDRVRRDSEHWTVRGYLEDAPAASESARALFAKDTAVTLNCDFKNGVFFMIKGHDAIAAAA